MKLHHVVVIPGIPAWTPLCKLLCYPWILAGLKMHVEDIHWTAEPADFQTKLEALLARIDAYATNGAVSMVGISAGGIAVLCAFRERKSLVHKVITICTARRTSGDAKSKNMGKYPAYDQAVAMLQHEERLFTPEDEGKILAVRGAHDEEMSAMAVPRPQVNDVRLPVIGHAFIIASALTIYSGRVIEFIKK